MPVIEPVPEADAEITESYGQLDPHATFPRILAHVDGYAEALTEAMTETLFSGGVPHELKELMRIQLAHTAQDPHFSDLTSAAATQAGLSEERIEGALGDFVNDPQFTDAEKWALNYAYLMYRQPDRVDATFYAEGKQHFTEAQIMEMGGLIAVHFGMQTFMRTLDN